MRRGAHARLVFVSALSLSPLAASCWLTIDEAKIQQGDGGVPAATDGPGPVDGATPAMDGAPGTGDAGAIDGPPSEAAPRDAAPVDAGACPSSVGPMVLVAAIDGGAYCVDATEVTNGQYAQFLAANPSTGAYQPQATCASWNTSYTPWAWTMRLGDAYPVQGADWCDAYAFCAWAGKHLCGAIGGGGALDPNGASFDPALSEWFNACSAGGKNAFPYGAAYDGQRCIDVDYTPQPTGPAAAGQTSTCAGGTSGIFDMSGNLAEWEDSCFTTGGDPACATDGGPECNLCHVRGGSWTQDAGWAKCAGDDGAYRKARLEEVGFRCCAR